MGLSHVVNKVFGRESSPEFNLLVCRECDATFESANHPKRAACPDCLSEDVAMINTTDSHT